MKQETTESPVQPELTIEQRIANMERDHNAISVQIQQMADQRLRIEGAILVLREMRAQMSPTADEAATEPVAPENQ